MSQSLYWRPIPEGNSLPDELKQAVYNKYQGKKTRITYSDYAYFEGLKDAGVKGAAEILDLIGIHNEIELFWD